MPDAIIICIIAAFAVLIAVGLIDYKIRKFERLMSSYKIEIENNVSNYCNLLDNRLIRLTIGMPDINHRYDKLIEAIKILTDVTKENTDRINCMHEYLNMFDDTVITTIRDNYNMTKEVRDNLNKFNEQTGGASLEYTDENFRKMLGQIVKENK